MKPSKLYEALHALIGERVPLHIWGACGVGKSQIVSQVAGDLDYDFRDVRAVQLDPVDLRGLPRIAVYLTEWVPMKFLPTAGKGVLFLDELVVDLPTPPWSAWNLSYSCNKSPLCGFSLILEGKVKDQFSRDPEESCV